SPVRGGQGRCRGRALSLPQADGVQQLPQVGHFLWGRLPLTGRQGGHLLTAGLAPLSLAGGRVGGHLATRRLAAGSPVSTDSKIVSTLQSRAWQTASTVADETGCPCSMFRTVSTCNPVTLANVVACVPRPRSRA